MSLLKVNEVQNYNGSSLTLTASTVSTSAQLNTGGNISVTGSLNVSDDSTTRSNLGLGSIATQASDNIAVTGGTATLGALTVSGSDSGNLVRITQTGSGNALVVEDSTNPDSSPFVVDASGNVGIQTSAPVAPLQIDSNALGDAPHLRLNNTNNTNGDTCNILFGFAGNDNANKGGIFFKRTNSYGRGDLIFATENSASNDNVDNSDAKLTIDSSGGISKDGGFSYSGSSDDFYFNTGGQERFRFYSGTTSSRNLIGFGNPNGVVGYIETSGSSTSYNTSSDYRLKENITDITDGINRVKQLNPSRFNFIADPDRTVDGFIAHEISDIIPEAVSGEKDAVNEDGSIKAQGIDQSKLVPLLTAALQESIALIESQQSQIDALTARIEALETK